MKKTKNILSSVYIAILLILLIAGATLYNESITNSASVTLQK
jgi:hypothetical protein